MKWKTALELSSTTQKLPAMGYHVHLTLQIKNWLVQSALSRATAKLKRKECVHIPEELNINTHLLYSSLFCCNNVAIAVADIH